MNLGKIKITVPQILLGCLVVFIVIIESKKSGDFKVFTEAAKLLKDHQNIYDQWLNNKSCKYYYSPLFALLLIPFVTFPDFIVNFLWLSANVFFFARIWKLTYSYFDFSAFNKKEKRIYVLITLALTIRFLLHNFENVQMTVYILWSILESLNLFTQKKYISGAFIFALAMNIKILPIVFLPYLLFRKKTVPFLWIVLFTGIFLYAPALLLGVGFNNFLLVEWGKALNPSNIEHSFIDDIGGQSLTTFLPTLLMQTAGEVPFKRNIANLDLNTVNFIISVARLLFVGFTLYFTGLTFYKNAKSKLHAYWEVSYLTLIIPIIFSHQEKYAFFLIFPATAYIVYFLIKSRQNNWIYISKTKWIVLVSLLFLSFLLNTMSSDLFGGRSYEMVCDHYKSIAYGSFLLLIILSFCQPYLFSKMEQECSR